MTTTKRLKLVRKVRTGRKRIGNDLEIIKAADTAERTRKNSSVVIVLEVLTKVRNSDPVHEHREWGYAENTRLIRSNLQ